MAMFKDHLIKKRVVISHRDVSCGGCRALLGLDPLSLSGGPLIVLKGKENSSGFEGVPNAEIYSNENTTFIRIFQELSDSEATILCSEIVDGLQERDVERVTILSALHLPMLKEGKLYTYTLNNKSNNNIKEKQTFEDLELLPLNSNQEIPDHFVATFLLLFNLTNIETMLLTTPSSKFLAKHSAITYGGYDDGTSSVVELLGMAVSKLEKISFSASLLEKHPVMYSTEENVEVSLMFT